MNFFILDASALAKRYCPELGSDQIDHLFQHVSHDRLMCLMWGAAEVVSVLVRAKNGGRLSPAAFQLGMNNLKAEILDDPLFNTLAADNGLVVAALPLIDKHALNASDAVLLRSSLDLARDLRADGHELVLVASDHRLLRAAQAEGLCSFNPETQMATELAPLC